MPNAENDRDDERLAIRDAWAELPLTAENDAAAWRSRAELLRNKLDAAEAEAERLRSALRDVITVANEARPWGVIPPTLRVQDLLDIADHVLEALAAMWMTTDWDDDGPGTSREVNAPGPDQSLLPVGDTNDHE